MASYGGQSFIGAQIASILEQLRGDDELVIVDDASPDGTVSVIRAIEDPRIRLIEQAENAGYVRTFEHALSEATGEFLLLADQDDLWAPGRVDAMCEALHGADVVASNLDLLEVTDRGARSTGEAIAGPLGITAWRLPRVGSQTPVRNSLGVLAGLMPYFGCAMGMTRSFATTVVLPFPQWLYESHDLWIALTGNIAGRVTHIDDVTTYRRLHDANASPAKPRSLGRVLRSRVLVLRMILAALRRRGAGSLPPKSPKATL